MPVKKSDTPQEGSRRSTRVADAQKKPRAAATKAKDAVKRAIAPATPNTAPKKKPAAARNAAPAPKKSAASKKRTKDEVDGDEEEAGDAEVEDAQGEEKPDAKKAKVEKKPKVAEGDKSSDFALGSTIPADIVLKNEKGDDVNMKELSEKGLVMFLVPKANTPGCTKQACAYRDSYADFTGTGYEVYCLSADSSASQAKWQTKETLPYPLLSDSSRTLIRALGAGTAGKTTRSHFIFEKGTGKLVDKKVPVVSTKSSHLALAFLRGDATKDDEEAEVDELAEP